MSEKSETLDQKGSLVAFNLPYLGLVSRSQMLDEAFELRRQDVPCRRENQVARACNSVLGQSDTYQAGTYFP